LYMGMGDGGSGDDPFNRAQSADTLLGKMLRIDVSVVDADPNGYRVPADNPFAGATPPIAALPEIWDFGMRNPFRFAFDIGPDGTGALIIADVGQNNREEIDYEPRGRGGRNYGWSIREGTRPNNTGFAAAFTPLTDPIYEYTHADGFVITGGFTYRGTALDPSLRGRYFFTDFGTARLWSIGLAVNPVTGAASVTNVIEHTAEVGGPALVGAVSSFGRDADGELYLVQYGGTIQKLVAPPDPPRVFFTADFNGDGRPDLLTQTVSGKVTVASSAPLSANFFNAIRVLWGDRTPWKVVGVADMDGDGAPDIIWQGPTGSIVYWFLVGAGVREIFTLYDGASLWRVAAVADIDHDGDADLIWQGPTGRVVVWELQGQGRTVTRARDLWGEASAWRIAGTADIDGDGDQDLLWQGPGGSIVVWTMAGGAVSSASYVFADKTPWTLIGVGDLNGDGQADFLWLSPTGQAGAWMMTGKLVLQFMYLNVIGAGPIWEISIAPNT
jgi:Glucose / Sorbosone dehydrogenase/FG-GAP-like repeat